MAVTIKLGRRNSLKRNTAAHFRETMKKVTSELHIALKKSANAKIPGLDATVERLFKETWEDSQAIVPIYQGYLKESGVFYFKRRPRSYEVVMSYGNPQVRYAIIQHENYNFRHYNQGQAKYLEKPILRNYPAIIKAINNRIAWDLKDKLKGIGK